MATKLTCSNTDNRYILEFIGCDLVVVQNSQTIFKAKELSLCPWFDEVCDYCYCKHTIPAGGSIQVTGPLNANFLYIKIDWPADLEASKRNAGITLPEFTITGGGTETTFRDDGLGEYTTHTYPISELLMLNSTTQYEEYKLHNYTGSVMTAHVITATHCDVLGTEDNTQPNAAASTPDFTS